MISHYKGNIVTALVELFPTIEIDETKFKFDGTFYSPNLFIFVTSLSTLYSDLMVYFMCSEME